MTTGFRAAERLQRWERRLRQYVAAVLVIAAATALCLVGNRVLGLPDVVMIYLLAIMLVALFAAPGPAVFAAALSVGAYDWFFVPPFFTFDVADTSHLLTFLTMFVIGVLISGLTLRLRRKEVEARLGGEAARVAAIRARTEEMRSSLLSAVSHDLRTPLAAITGAASTLRADEGRLTAAQRGELLDAISDESDRLERLVRNLLDMTRLESGGMQPRREWVPLDEIVGAAIARVEHRLGSRPLEVVIAPDVPLLHVDPILVEQVFVNLLENAAKYTSTGSPIELRADVVEESVVVSIADRGPGLAVGDEQRVFEKFQRGPHAGVPGSGLGLAICKGIVEAHGGEIHAEAREGGGTVFRFALPLEGEAPPVPDADESAALPDPVRSPEDAR